MIFRKLRHFPLFKNSENEPTGIPLPMGKLFYFDFKYDHVINPLAEEERRFAAYVERLRASFREMIREEVNNMLAASCNTPEQLTRVAESIGYPVVESE